MGRPLDLSSKNWERVKQEIINRDKRCFICFTKKELSVHHIKAREEGGKTVGRNLITLCERCHNLIEGDETDWAAVINLRNQRRWDFEDGKFEESRKKYVGKDRLGTFVIKDYDPKKPIVYKNGWPSQPGEKELVPCQSCQREFYPSRTGEEYCSEECHEAAIRKKYSVIRPVISV